MKQENTNHNQLRKNLQGLIGLLVLLLALVVGFNAWLLVGYIPSRVQAGVTAIKSRYPFLDPGRTFTDPRDLIINIQPLRDKLNSYQSNSDFEVSIYFEYLATGANIAVNKDRTLWPASLLKIPVAMAVMKKVERGQWKLDNELVLLSEDRNSEFGTLYQKPLGTRFTIAELLHQALVYSDNIAHFILLRNIEEEELIEIYQHLGLEELRKQASSRMSAKQYSIFFRSLYTSSYLDPASAQYLLDILDNDVPGPYLRAGLPAGTHFANKTGIQEDKRVINDSGIVYFNGRSYILTVMLQDRSDALRRDKAEQVMAEISRQVYSYVSSYRL
ncbi:MAG: serine hydrolase [Candidatus Kerfeldbacteria bacterium]|nr:serine hydrolase [Candidatus Kerfeldbacteria bacterium]